MNRIIALNSFRKHISGTIRFLQQPKLLHRRYSMVPLSENGPSPYIKRENESITDKRARLLYQSRKRGMLENGLILSTFAERYLNRFDLDQLNMYDQMINIPSNDWDLYYWATGVKDTPPEFENSMMELLKNHVRNENRESRIRQPDLH